MRVLPFCLGAALTILPGWAQPEQGVGSVSQHAEQKVKKEIVPSFPTPEEVAALAPELREQHSNGIKQVLLLQYARMREAQHRLTPETLADCAGLARELECPAAFVDNLQRLSEGNMSPRQRYEWNQALNFTIQIYGIDALAVRLAVEDFPQNADAWQKLASHLPLSVVFNSVPKMSDDAQTIIKDFQTMAQVLRDGAKVYASITDEASAKAAIPALHELLHRYHSTLALRYAITEHLPLPLTEQQIKEKLDMVNAAYAEYMLQRKRLSEKSFFSVKELPILDYFLG